MRRLLMVVTLLTACLVGWSVAEDKPREWKARPIELEAFRALNIELVQLREAQTKLAGRIDAALADARAVHGWAASDRIDVDFARGYFVIAAVPAPTTTATAP